MRRSSVKPAMTASPWSLSGCLEKLRGFRIIGFRPRRHQSADQTTHSSDCSIPLFEADDMALSIMNALQGSAICSLPMRPLTHNIHVRILLRLARSSPSDASGAGSVGVRSRPISTAERHIYLVSIVLRAVTHHSNISPSPVIAPVLPKVDLFHVSTTGDPLSDSPTSSFV